MEHILPELQFAYNALEPWIDAKTMELHHAKHHATYVTKLNEALGKHPELADRPLAELLRDLTAIPEDIRTAVRNHGGGHLNHSLFWSLLSPAIDATPSGTLATVLDASFGSFEEFQKSFTSAALGLFGSGWVWVVASRDEKRETRDELNTGKRLQILTTQNQDTPLAVGAEPILGLDVWEHAYYLKHQNRRADYIAAWWHVVNWEEAARRLAAL